MNKVAYLGIPGSNTYQAAQMYFGKGVDFISCRSFNDIFEIVDSGSVDYGIIAIENSLAGTVIENVRSFDSYNVHIVGEQCIKLEHHLLSNHLTDDIKNVKTVYSHPQALMQCRKFLSSQTHIQQVAYGDTASSAKLVSDNKSTTEAAIANKEAARLYNLQILVPLISDDNTYNHTRFFIISKKKEHIANADKLSILFTLIHKPGSLVDVLSTFSDNNMNLVVIESQPIHDKPFEYIFYTDIVFDNSTLDKIPHILERIKEKTHFMKVLGVYKSALLPVSQKK